MEGNMQKWEYCAIVGVDSVGGFMTGNYPKLLYFGPNGIYHEVDLGNKASSSRPKGFEKVSEGGYIACTIAELGLEGWEMVGVGQASQTGGTGGYQSLYFKRPVE